MAENYKNKFYKVVQIKNWDDFQETIVQSSADQKYLYRGHANPEWDLESTLYRKNKDIPVLKYRENTYYALQMLESLTSHRWNLSIDVFRSNKWHSNCDQIEGKTEDKDEDSDIRKQKRKQNLLLGYFAYVRHQGYPSPLLDWTASPYVAAFFAFSEEIMTDNMSIFQYKDKYTRKATLPICIKYIVDVYRHNIRTHKQHYLQHSAYMLSIKREADLYKFGSTEEALLRIKESNTEQDVVVRYDIPSELRIEFLAKLDLMNINYMTLFTDEQAMIKTLAMRHYDLSCE